MTKKRNSFGMGDESPYLPLMRKESVSVNDTAHHVIDHLLALQEQVLGDPRISNDTKLMLCKLICQSGFRWGWILTDARWTAADLRSIRELDLAGYLTLSHNRDHGFGVRLRQRRNEEE
jgi:hypothetical protein